MMTRSCCDECVHCKRLPAKINADPEDCYPAEDWCDEDSENYGTPDGCRYFEERTDW